MAVPVLRLVRQLRLWVLVLSLTVAGACAWAQASRAASASAPASAGGISWDNLDPVQQGALAPLAKEWDRLPEARKRKWQEVADRFDRMTPAQRQRVQQRMAEWARMSPQERDRARLNYQKAKQVPASERQARWEAYQALSPEQRRSLAAKASPASASADAGPLRNLRRAPVGAQAPKSNIVRPPQGAGTTPRPVAPVLVQGRPGASTSLVNQSMKPPPHQPAGQPKITLSPTAVDPNTLLPRQGPAGRAGKPPAPPAPRASGAAR